MLKFLEANEVAKIFRVKTERVYALVREGVFPPGVVVRLGRNVRFNEKKLHEWIENGGQAWPGLWKKEA